MAESLHMSIPTHQNRIMSSNREPNVFNNFSTLHGIGTYHTKRQILNTSVKQFLIMILKFFFFSEINLVPYQTMFNQFSTAMPNSSRELSLLENIQP